MKITKKIHRKGNKGNQTDVLEKKIKHNITQCEKNLRTRRYEICRKKRAKCKKLVLL